MFTYTAKEIKSHIYNHYKIDDDTGRVDEVFGWTNYGVDDFREALSHGIEVALHNHIEKSKKLSTRLRILAGKWLKSKTIIDAIFKLEGNVVDLHDTITLLIALKHRIRNATDLSDADRPSYTYRAKVSDSLRDECSKYIKITTLRDDELFVLDSPLLVWRNNDDNKFYSVAHDFEIREHRVGVAGYEHDLAKGAVSVSYLMHNFKTDYTQYGVSYDAETGNYLHCSVNCNGPERIESYEIFYANIEDAIMESKKGIAALKKKNRAVTKAATEHLDRLAA